MQDRQEDFQITPRLPSSNDGEGQRHLIISTGSTVGLVRRISTNGIIISTTSLVRCINASSSNHRQKHRHHRYRRHRHRRRHHHRHRHRHRHHHHHHHQHQYHFRLAGNRINQEACHVKAQMPRSDPCSRRGQLKPCCSVLEVKPSAQAASVA